MKPVEYMTNQEVLDYIERIREALTYLNEKELPYKYRSAETLIHAGLEMLEERNAPEVSNE